MGLTPPGWEEGALCATCWGWGKPWPGRPTPLRVNCEVSGLIGLCGMANGLYYLKQLDANPCMWRKITDRFQITWAIFPGATSMHVFDHIRVTMCFAQISGPCQTLFIAGDKRVRIT